MLRHCHFAICNFLWKVAAVPALLQTELKEAVTNGHCVVVVRPNARPRQLTLLLLEALTRR